MSKIIIVEENKHNIYPKITLSIRCRLQFFVLYLGYMKLDNRVWQEQAQQMSWAQIKINETVTWGNSNVQPGLRTFPRFGSRCEPDAFHYNRFPTGSGSTRSIPIRSWNLASNLVCQTKQIFEIQTLNITFFRNWFSSWTWNRFAVPAQAQPSAVPKLIRSLLLPLVSIKYHSLNYLMS